MLGDTHSRDTLQATLSTLYSTHRTQSPQSTLHSPLYTPHRLRYSANTLHTLLYSLHSPLCKHTAHTSHAQKLPSSEKRRVFAAGVFLFTVRCSGGSVCCREGTVFVRCTLLCCTVLYSTALSLLCFLYCAFSTRHSPCCTAHSPPTQCQRKTATLLLVYINHQHIPPLSTLPLRTSHSKLSTHDVRRRRRQKENLQDPFLQRCRIRQIDGNVHRGLHQVDSS